MRRWGGRVVAACRGRGPSTNGSCYTTQLRDIDVPETTFTGHDLMTFLGLDALGLMVGASSSRRSAR